MVKKSNDNLNGTRTNLFNWPGKAILWISYIGAEKGKVFKTARRARSPLYTNFVSLIFWAIFLLLFGVPLFEVITGIELIGDSNV